MHTKTNTAQFLVSVFQLCHYYMDSGKISHWYSYSQISFFFKKNENSGISPPGSGGVFLHPEGL
ncbi:hypothetical protein EBB54_10460 [Schaedlerella arabinosiphila]|uniref:Uncharacterized protein n=1 Tax=Schaedlerella arabinosiphila TaxID=2044587 RepID=A0A426DG00_9FIRM|nr:hypothetical protein EBB54_10460 [Schaedlerella arabinosiphila]